MICLRWARRTYLVVALLLIALYALCFQLAFEPQRTPAIVQFHAMPPPSPPRAHAPPAVFWPQFSTWQQDRWTVPDPTRRDQGFMQKMINYAIEGHSYRELQLLGQEMDVSSAKIGVSLYLEDAHLLPTFVGLLTRQTISPASLSVHYAGKLALSDMELPLHPLTFLWSVHHVDNKHQWLASLPLEDNADLWLLDGTDNMLQRAPSAFLSYLYRTSLVPEYQSALLGVHGMLLPANLNSHLDRATEWHCLPSLSLLPAVSQPADLLLGSWLLKKEWRAHLQQMASSTTLPVPFLISQALSRNHIPTVVLPPPDAMALDDETVSKTVCATIYRQFVNDPVWQKEQMRRSAPSALDRRQIALTRHPSMVYLVENAHQAQALVPLLCRPQQHMIHVLVAGSQGMSGSALQRTLMGIDTLSCLGRDWITVHDLDAHDANTFATHMMQIIDILRPHVVLHVSPPESSLDQLLATIAPKQPWTLIAMPQDQVRHALWLPDLPLQALRHWNRISIQLVIITDRRPHSLSRLLHSCSKSFFLGDKVDVTINMEQSADKVTRTLVQSYNWMHGKKTLRHRVQKGGLMPAIVESWYPRHDDDYGVLLEDDISLSPLFYTWLKYNILKYRYSPVDAHDSMLAERIFGISLYSPRNVELHLVGRRPFDPTAVLYNSTYPARIPYASQVPCSWGAVYFPQQWREFHAFLTAQLDDMAQNQVLNISLPMSRSDRWKKSWKKYLIQMVYLRGYVMVYPNYQDFESFATNHLETGTHVKSEKRQRIIDSFLVPLMARNTLLHQLPDQRLPDLAKMPVLDLWGKLVSHDILQSRADRWHTRVSACERSVTRALDDPSDLLCPFSLVPAWDRPGYRPPYKKIKIPTLTEVVEPLAYQTAVARMPDSREDTQDDDFPWRIDVAVLNPVTDEIAVHDDELADLVANLRA